MRTSVSKLSFWFLVAVSTFLFSGETVRAQGNSSSPPPSNPARVPARTPPPMSAEKRSSDDDGPPLTTFEEEMRAKRLIKLAEREHKQNLERARELSQLAKELQDNFKSSSSFDPKRLERLEKLTKKIRGEAGGEDDEVQIVDRPGDKRTAVSRIAEVAESLSKTVQNTPRQVVAAGVIDSANVLLELIRILRTLPQ
jgi:hypothetical protein